MNEEDTEENKFMLAYVDATYEIYDIYSVYGVII